MSHHLDTPLARQNGQLYIDDLCVFDAGRTASRTRPSSQSCSRSLTSIQGSVPARAAASGARPSSRPTPVAGGRSTAPATR